jgi:glycosyltransferase involved in cell wall biosynthesis
MDMKLMQQTSGRLNQPTPNYPLITVIVAVYNGVRTLQQCIDSIAQQSYPAKELIVIDGASTDGTVEIVEQNKEKIAYWVSEPDRGIYNAWNKGLEQVKGEWICFLGADDYFLDKNVLEQAAKCLAMLPDNICVAYSQVMLLNTEEALYPIGEPWEKIKKRFKQFMCIPHQGVLHRRRLFEVHGPFDESFRIAGDYDLLLRDLKTSDAFFIPNLILTVMRLGGVSTDPGNALAGLREFRRAQLNNGLRFPGWVWLTAVARAYARLLLVNLLGEPVARKVLDFRRRIMRKLLS